VTRQPPLERVRALCLALPETTERPSHSSPAWFIRDKFHFASYLDNHHGDGRLAIWCAAGPGDQAVLVESNPDVYFVPPYVGTRGWVGVQLNKGAGWDEIAAVIEDAYRVRAPAGSRIASPSKHLR